MRIKKFIAANLTIGKANILKELGEDAVILSSRTIKKPGDSTAEVVEIVAAIDDSPARISQKPFANSLRPQIVKNNDSDEEKKFFDITSKLYDEIGSIKNSIIEINSLVKYKYSGVLHENFKSIYTRLLERRFSENFALKIIGSLSQKAFYDKPNEAINYTKELITEHILLKESIKKENHCVVSFFIGPTGCGKTTTLIKTAILCKLLHEANVLIISADTQKVGGAEQLQTYSSIASIPFFSVYSVKDLKELLKNENKRDFIFIDTVGCSPINLSAISEINAFIDTTQQSYKYLVLDMNYSVSSFINAVKNFSVLNPSGLILTKFDEVKEIGEVIEALQDISIPLAYFATGQKIPNDMETANKEKLQNLIFDVPL